MEDEALRPLILDPFDYQGVDTLDTSSVVLLLRIRTVASKQWVVARAFNRLVKIAFDKHGIASRDPVPARSWEHSAGTTTASGLPTQQSHECALRCVAIGRKNYLLPAPMPAGAAPPRSIR